jgi:hypothetical protein
MKLHYVVAVPLFITFMLAWALGVPQAGSTPSGDPFALTPAQAAQQAVANGATAKTGPADQSAVKRPRPDRPHYVGESGRDHPQEWRYDLFFGQVLEWDSASKQAAAKGDTVMAEGFQTYLQRKSGLTAEEAACVLHIALQWAQDEQAAAKNAREVIAAVRAANPGVHMTGMNSPEIRVAGHQRWVVSEYAVNQLVTALGSKSFSKLDFFVDHVDDHAKEVKARSDAYRAAHPEVKP